VLHAKGISVHGQYSKGLQCEDLKTPHLIVNMSGIPGNSLFAGKKFEDWIVEDPFARTSKSTGASAIVSRPG